MTRFVEEAIEQRILRETGNQAKGAGEKQVTKALAAYRDQVVVRNRAFILDRVRLIGPDLKDPTWQHWMAAKGLTREQVEAVIKEAKV